MKGTTLAPSDDREPAVLVALGGTTAGGARAYAMLVRGKANASGTAGVHLVDLRARQIPRQLEAVA